MELNSELDRAQRNLTDLVKLVAQMREHQRNYFRYRDRYRCARRNRQKNWLTAKLNVLPASVKHRGKTLLNIQNCFNMTKNKVADLFTLINLFIKALMEVGTKKLIVILSAAISKSQERNSLDELKKVADYIGIRADDIQVKTRKRDIVEARQVAMYLAKRNTKESLVVIGQNIGSKDHATVLHACKTVENLLETNRGFRKKWLPLIISQ